MVLDQAGTNCRFDCLADVVSKIGGTVGALAGGAWTVWLYFQSRKKELQARKQEAITAELNAKEGFLSKRLELYFEATTCAATIATSQDENEVEAAKKRFWILYWGPMCVIEDKRVEKVMMDFGEALTIGDRSALQAVVYQLAHTCRNSLASDWRIVDPHNVPQDEAD